MPTQTDPYLQDYNLATCVANAAQAFLPFIQSPGAAYSRRFHGNTRSGVKAINIVALSIARRVQKKTEGTGRRNGTEWLAGKIAAEIFNADRMHELRYSPATMVRDFNLEEVKAFFVEYINFAYSTWAHFRFHEAADFNPLIGLPVPTEEEELAEADAFFAAHAAALNEERAAQK